jgi:hypothetical protein
MKPAITKAVLSCFTDITIAIDFSQVVTGFNEDSSQRIMTIGI